MGGHELHELHKAHTSREWACVLGAYSHDTGKDFIPVFYLHILLFLCTFTILRYFVQVIR